MDIDTHIRRVENRLSYRPGVVSVENPNIKRLPTKHGNRAAISVRLYFFDGSFLDMEEIIDTYKCFPEYLKYSYHYEKDGKCVFRYDNSPHHPEVATHPYHKHIGPDDNENIEASGCPSHSEIFREIIQYITQTM